MTEGGPRPWQGGWDGEWKDPKFTWGICQHPEPKVNHNESGFARSESAPISGGWVTRCHECHGDVHRNERDESVCVRCGLVDERESDKTNSAYYNPDACGEELPYYADLTDQELDTMIGKENRKRIREINNPKINTAIKKLKPISLKILKSPNFQKIMRRGSFVEDGHEFHPLEWNIYHDQIKRYSPPNYGLWVEQRKVERAYYEIRLKEEYRAIMDTPPNSPYQPWHYWLINLRNPISKHTGLDYKAVDRALTRMAKKQIRADRIFYDEIRNNNGFDWNKIEHWQYKLDRADEARSKGWRNDELFWLDFIYFSQGNQAESP